MNRYIVTGKAQDGLTRTHAIKAASPEKAKARFLKSHPNAQGVVAKRRRAG